MNIVRDWVIPAAVIIMVIAMIAFWVINCIQVNQKRQSVLPQIIVAVTGVMIIIAVMLVKLDVIDRIGGTENNAVVPIETFNLEGDTNGEGNNQMMNDAGGVYDPPTGGTEAGGETNPIYGQDGGQVIRGEQGASQGVPGNGGAPRQARDNIQPPPNDAGINYNQ